MDRHQLVQRKLTEVTDDEWLVAMQKCKKVINLRTKGKTDYGAHSEQRLEMPPFDYYFQKALDKLYEGEWDWKFENYSLAEQLVRVIGSLISEEVRKYKVEQKRMDAPVIQSYEVVEFSIGEIPDEIGSAEKEEIFQNQLKIVEHAIEGDDDAEDLFILIQYGKSNEEICEELGWTKAQLYKVSERMRTKAKKKS